MQISREMLANLFDPRRDLDKECGYPSTIRITEYVRMAERGLGRRVVNLWPSESWGRMPTIREAGDGEPNTPFDDAWQALESKGHVLPFLHRIDTLSGVGRYGVLFLGIKDDQPLDQPVDAVLQNTAPPDASPDRLLYLRPFHEGSVSVETSETDQHSPRYGRPTMYKVSVGAGGLTSDVRVHWTRVLHVADNRASSEVYGEPRQQPVWDRLLDLRKILGGSAEMFWRGGFPGLSFETQPGMEDAEMDIDQLKGMIEDYQNGLQRYLATVGLTARSLTPQIADPSAVFDVQIKALCVTLGVPYRVFLGTEEGKLAGSEDAKAWRNRVAGRQAQYVSPEIIDPFIERMQLAGVLPQTKEPGGWTITWPDLHTPSAGERAEVAERQAKAVATYMQSGSDALVPPSYFLTKMLGLPQGDVDTLLADAVQYNTEE